MDFPLKTTGLKHLNGPTKNVGKDNKENGEKISFLLWGMINKTQMLCKQSNFNNNENKLQCKKGFNLIPIETCSWNYHF